MDRLTTIEVGMPGPAGTGITAAEKTAFDNRLTALETAPVSPVVAVGKSNTDFANADTINNADAVSISVTLPAGTWTLTAIGGVSAYHSAATATILVALSLNANVGTTANMSGVPIGDRVTLVTTHSIGSGGGGAVTCKVVFHSSTAGTMTVDQSWIQVIATRTA